MARNIGPEDRVFRIVIGLVLAVLAYHGVLPGISTIFIAVAAAY
jgi:hypothetical protein